MNNETRIETEYGNPIILENMRDLSLCVQVGDVDRFNVTYMTKAECALLIEKLKEWLGDV